MTVDLPRLRGLLRERFHDDYPADDLEDFMHRHASPLDAFFYRTLFWPDFIELEGMVFFSSAVDWQRDRIQPVLQQYEGDRERTERSFNLVEVPYLFGNPDPSGDIDDDLYVELARQLSEVWEARVTSMFPGRSFKFEIDEEDASLWFFEVRA